MTQERWDCAARQRNILPDAQDCDWPVCGCDPYASKVLDAIAESGFVIVRAYPVAYRWKYVFSEWGEWRWVYVNKKPDWSGATYEVLYATHHQTPTPKLQQETNDAVEPIPLSSAAHASFEFCDWLYGYMGHSTAIKIDDYAASYIRQKLAAVVKANDEARESAKGHGCALPETVAECHAVILSLRDDFNRACRHIDEISAAPSAALTGEGQ